MQKVGGGGGKTASTNTYKLLQFQRLQKAALRHVHRPTEMLVQQSAVRAVRTRLIRVHLRRRDGVGCPPTG